MNNILTIAKIEDMKKEAKIGVFVVIVLTATFFVINFLRGKDLLGREMEVKAYYENVEGLLPSAPVYIKGYKAGTVKEVSFLPREGRFEVECSIQKQFAVPEDSRMVIYGVDIMGGKGVRIDMGQSAAPAGDGSVLEGSCEPDLISAVSAGITPLMSKAAAAVDSLSAAAAAVNRILASVDPVVLESTLMHVERTMANAERVSWSINGKSEELASLIDNLSSVSVKLGSAMGKVDSTMTNVTEITSALSAADIEGLLSSFRGLIEKVQDPDGTLGKILSDDSVYLSADALLEDIDTLVRKIAENPKKYIRISIF